MKFSLALYMVVITAAIVNVNATGFFTNSGFFSQQEIDSQFEQFKVTMLH